MGGGAVMTGFMIAVKFSHIFYSALGLYVQGIYRKSPGASSKRAVKATLEEGT